MNIEDNMGIGDIRTGSLKSGGRMTGVLIGNERDEPVERYVNAYDDKPCWRWPTCFTCPLSDCEWTGTPNDLTRPTLVRDGGKVKPCGCVIHNVNDVKYKYPCRKHK